MPKVWVLYLLALTSSVSLSSGFSSSSGNEENYYKAVQGEEEEPGCSGAEGREEEGEDEEFMDEEEEINESVIEAWSKAYRSNNYQPPVQREERQSINCTGNERDYCLKSKGLCQSENAQCLGDRKQGKNYCKNWRFCACCSPSECNVGTKPYCSETCHGTCMRRNQRCPGYYLLGHKYCHTARSCKCCIIPPKSCRYAGVKYSHGTQLPGTCMEMLCQDGEWCPSSKISRDCSLCYIRDDPHFDTFDDSVYDWHGQCNYTLITSDQSYDPSYAVYGDLVDCMGGATCLVTVVFKDNYQTVITIGQTENVFQVNVNGVDYILEGGDCAQYIPDTNVLWWNVSGCIRMLGTQGLVVTMCYILEHYRELYVWAPPSLNSSLYGLCGHNNGVEGDDFVLRNDSIIQWDNFAEQFSFPYPIAPEEFPKDWQTDPSCDPSHSRQLRGVNVSAEFPCQASDPMWTAYKAQCESIVNGELIDGQALSDSQKRRYTATCAFDMCMIYQASVNTVPGPMPSMANWEQAVKIMVQNRIQIELASRVCPAGFDIVGTECFKIHEKKTEAWSIARLLCLAEGTYLAEPSNPQYLLLYLQSQGKNSQYWLGGRGNGTDMLWLRSREIVSAAHYQTLSIAETEVLETPIYDVTKDYCLEIRAESMSGPLAIWECVKRHYFICQYNNKYAYN